MADGTDARSLVLSAVDIVQLIGQSVKLTRRGREYLGLCPFHQEKTPSFYVVPEKRLFHCFGCKASGNAIDFVMRRDRVEFREALRVAAEFAGIDLPRSGDLRKQAGERQQLLDACASAVAFFEKSLHDPTTGRSAREYLAGRGFTPDAIRRFNLGFAPDSWDALLSALSRKTPPAVLHKAGLIKARENDSGFYDAFRNRLMFPIRDETGRTIAFGGRIMPGPDADRTAKYLNSPETPLFHKGKAVFGLDLARQKIIETRTAAIVEGYTDVVMAHQYGASNVVSILGTAMTDGHVNLLRRFADRIVLLFDADAAGDSAVDRTVELFLTQPVEIAIATMPEGLDPDEFLIQHGAGGFSDLLNRAVDALTYKWERLRRQFVSADGITGQQRAVAAYLEVLGSARRAGPVDDIRWGAALKSVERLTGIPADDLHRRFALRPRPRVARGSTGVTDVARASTGDADAGGTSVVDRTPAVWTATDRAESWVLGAVLADPTRWDDVQQVLQPQDFTSEARRALAELTWDVARHDGHVEVHELMTLMPDDGMKSLAVSLVTEVEALPDAEQALREAVQHLRDRRVAAAQAESIAQLNRLAKSATPEAQIGSDEEEALFRRLVEQAKRPDMRRGLR